MTTSRKHVVALVTALVHRDLAEACKAVKGKSVDDRLLEARMVKGNKVGGKWVCRRPQVQTGGAVLGAQHAASG